MDAIETARELEEHHHAAALAAHWAARRAALIRAQREAAPVAVTERGEAAA